MARFRRAITTTAATLATVLVAVACGGESPDTADDRASAKTTAPPAASDTGGPATVGVATSPQYGQILVDGQGRTLYLFAPDTNGSSTCYGRCAQYWPPLLTQGKPTAGNGAVDKYLDTTQRHDGTTQVSYRGHPLYYYISDTRPGDVTGQLRDEFGAWYVLAPNGNKIDTY